MDFYESQVEQGMNLLALFSPAQVSVISKAVSAHGIGLGLAVEKHQVKQLYPNNALGALDPIQLEPEVLANLCRTLGLIWRDALVTNWTESQYVDMIVQSTGISEDAATTMAKQVITNDDAAITHFMVDNPLIENFTFGLAPAIAQLTDDLIDWFKDKNTGDNLWQFNKCGEMMKDVMLRMKMKGIETKAEMQGLARVDAQELRRTQLPETIMSLVDTALTIRSAMESGQTETGEPYDPTLGQKHLAQTSSAIQRGLKLMSRKVHPNAEEGGWLGDVLSFVGNTGKGIIQGIGKKIRKRRRNKRPALTVGNRGNIRQLANTMVRRTGSARPRSARDLEVIISTK